MSARQALQSLIEDLMIGCRGWIEALVIVSEDGTPVACSSNIDFEPDYIAAATCSIAGATSAVLELLNSTGFDRIDIRLREGRYLLVRRYQDYYLVALTKPNPNLGFINLIFESYLSGGR
ncbi:MAG: roadblock/LC7 domain-containing protein [Thaumarchaeota archaeon]|nr:roadblock/LC7 domain-containing protein [Nitrososphaerota archaeon]